jgi:hypothetical protein
MHVYEVRPRKDHRGVDLISDLLPFGLLWYGGPNAVGYAKFRSRSHDAVIRVYDAAGNVVETPTTRAISESGERSETKSRHAMVVSTFTLRMASGLRSKMLLLGVNHVSEFDRRNRTCPKQTQGG